MFENGCSKVIHNEFIKNIDQLTDKFINYLNNIRFNYSLLGLTQNPILKCKE